MTTKSVVLMNFRLSLPLHRAVNLCKYWRMPVREVYQPRVPRNEQRIVVRGADYCIYEWGSASAPLFVYLHGWGDTGSTFQFVIDALNAEWRVVAPDWRGFGRSAAKCTSYWFPDYLADLHVLLEKISPDDPVRLVGHSMGANVAALYAGTMPERVQALVNIEGFGLADSNPDDAPARYRAWIEAMNEEQRFSEYDDLSALASRLVKRHPLLGVAESNFVANEWAAQGSDGVTRLRADPRHKLPNPVLYRRAEAQACWRGITAEALMILGSASRFQRHFSEASPPPFPQDRQVVIEGGGHMLHFELPGALATAIEEFLLPTL